MHPSKAIKGRKSTLLSGKRIVLGITGSIAAVEAVRLIRELLRHGAEVIPVLSSDAASLITPSSIEFAAGRPPIERITGQVEHVSLFGPGEGRADMLLIAPATANTISKIATGVSDNAVTTCASMAIGAHVPILLSPAMHSEMEQNPFVAENLEKLVKAGVRSIPPKMEEGEAKLPPPETIAAHVLNSVASGPLSGSKVVVIGGSTIVPLDDVRYVTNGSSGTMGTELAKWAFQSGASVSLWLGEASVEAPEFLETTRFRTRKELDEIVKAKSKLLKQSSMIVVPAAISDYDNTNVKKGKIDSSSQEKLKLELVRAPKLLKTLRKLAPPPVRIVGFKLTSGKDRAGIEEAARNLMTTEELDGVVANDASAMGSSETSVIVLRKGFPLVDLSGKKTEVSLKLVELLGELVK